MAKMAGMKLRCKDGHWEFATWELVPGANSTYALRTRRDYGDQWLTEDGGTVGTRTTPQWWPTIAEAARDRWERQEAGK